MPASAPARLARANSLALSPSLLRLLQYRCAAPVSHESTSPRTMPSKRAMVLPDQKYPIWVCSGVRVTPGYPTGPPRAFTSLYALVYSRLVSAGGRRARNCSLKSIVNGSTAPSHGVANGASAGGVGRHWPAPVPPRSGGGGGIGKLPSPARFAMIAEAACSPTNLPSSASVNL